MNKYTKDIFVINTDLDDLKFICNRETGRWVIAKKNNKQVINEISHPVKGKGFTGVSQIVLNVGRKCNFSCKYCHVGSKKNNHESLDDNIWKIVLKNIIEIKDKNIQLVFHGSEPMMYYKYIKKYVNDCKKSGINIEFCLQSNGSLFTKENVKWLVKNNVGIGISCDGLDIYQDKTRTFKNFKPTSKIIKKKIELVKDIQGGISIITVVSSNNVNNLDSIIKTFDGMGVDSILFNPVYVEKNNELLPNTNELISSYYNIFDEYLNQCIQKSNTIEIENFKKILKLFFKPKTTTNCTLCGAGPNHPLLAIDIDGAIYECDYLWGNSVHKLGEIGKYTLLNSINSSKGFRAKREINDIEDCRECNWKYFCGGGCPGGMINTGMNENCKDIYCEFYKALFHYMAKKIPLIHAEELIPKFIEKN